MSPSELKIGILGEPMIHVQDNSNSEARQLRAFVRVVARTQALQGAFAEHESIFRTLRPLSPQSSMPIPLHVTLVKTPSDLASCDALIIPGGESTTIALLARLNGLLEPLREFVQRKPVWGTCAGAILLASGGVVGAKRGGQEIIGGFDVRVERNGWGSQLESFEADLPTPNLDDGDRPFRGVFIRAPVILALTPPDDHSRPPIKVLATLTHHFSSSSGIDDLSSAHDARAIVAARQGRHLLTTFHPELTRDSRFHRYFIEKCVLGSDVDSEEAAR